MKAWAALADGGENPLAHLLADDEHLRKLLDPAEIRTLLDPTHHIGDAAVRARKLADKIDGMDAFPQTPVTL